jgi:hypothetical protein
MIYILERFWYIYLEDLDGVIQEKIKGKDYLVIYIRIFLNRLQLKVGFKTIRSRRIHDRSTLDEPIAMFHQNWHHQS